jgi:hypothetical protein
MPSLDGPTRSEVAASSRPKQLIVSALKHKEKEKAGQTYKPSKRDAIENQNINWKSPTFWPIIDQVVREQIGKPNLSEIIRILQSRDQRFKHLTHQRLSDWRDKTQKAKFVWSEKTLLDVQKGFLPGGNQTCFNVFVSFLHIKCRNIANIRNSITTLIYFLRSKSP